MTAWLMSSMSRPRQFIFHNMKKKNLQKDILMIKSLQPSVGVMKWLGMAEDLVDLL